MLASLLLHVLTDPAIIQQTAEQAEFEKVLLQARVLHDEPSTYEISKVTWSPDGKWGGYTIEERRRKPGEYLQDRDQMTSLCVVSGDRKTVKRLDTGHPFGGKSEDPTGCNHTLPRVIGWSPSGDRLLYYKDYPMGTVAVAGSSLHDANPRTGKIRELTKLYQHGKIADHRISFGGSFFFSPDGRELMLVFGSHKYDPYGLQIAVVDYHSLARRWLTLDNVVCYDPQWSPSGSRVAYSARSKKLEVEEKEQLERYSLLHHNFNRLWVVKSDGAGKVQLTHDSNWVDDSPRWIDEQTIQFVRGKNDNSVPEELWEIKADGSELKRVKAITYEEQVAWREQNENYLGVHHRLSP